MRTCSRYWWVTGFLIAGALATFGDREGLVAVREAATTQTASLPTAAADTKLKIVCLGGSSTAGAGVAQAEQYPALLQANLRAAGYSKATVLNRAHGSTDTFYAAIHFDSLVPPDADIVTWEYAINDVGELKKWRRDGDLVEDSLVWFMRQVAQHPNRPALIFVFLWDSPFVLPLPGRTVWDHFGPTLVAMNQSIVDMNQWVRDTYTTNMHNEYFVADQHHMNSFSHSHVAVALQSIVSTERDDLKRGEALLNGWPNDYANRASLWHGALPPGVRTQALLFDKPTMTVESDFGLRTVKYSGSGKAEGNRVDRMIDLMLPRCGSGEFLRMNVAASPSERVLRVLVGEGTAGGYAMQLRWSQGCCDGKPSPLNFTFEPAMAPLGPSYHQYFTRWYEPPHARRAQVSGNGTLWVCGPGGVRWVDVLITKAI